MATGYLHYLEVLLLTLTSYHSTTVQQCKWLRGGGRGGGADCSLLIYMSHMVGSLKMNTALEYSTRVVQEGDLAGSLEVFLEGSGVLNR